MFNFSQIPTIKIELLGQVNVYLGLGLSILTALILGGLVGLEREAKLKAAGIKTNILICLGSCLYTSISLLNYSAQLSSNDPNRVAAQIVSGIGFLGAGAIIQGKGGVMGLTTAATIWVVAAIGVACGMGYPFSAAIFTITVLVVLKIVDPVLQKLGSQENVYMNINILSDMTATVEQILEDNDIYVHRYERSEINNDLDTVHCYIKLTPKTLKNVLFQLRQLKAVKKVTHRKISDFNEDHHDED